MDILYSSGPIDAERDTSNAWQFPKGDISDIHHVTIITCYQDLSIPVRYLKVENSVGVEKLENLVQGLSMIQGLYPEGGKSRTPDYFHIAINKTKGVYSVHDGQLMALIQHRGGFHDHLAERIITYINCCVKPIWMKLPIDKDCG